MCSSWLAPCNTPTRHDRQIPSMVHEENVSPQFPSVPGGWRHPAVPVDPDHTLGHRVIFESAA
jgi:hypothetical protein